MKSTTIAVDLAKKELQIAVSHHPGKVAETHRVARARFLSFFAERQPCLVLLEACGTAHSWARKIQALGHEVKLLPPHAVRPYVRGNKTDRADAKALLEAHRNEEIHPVPVKSKSQQVLTGLHRLRSAWMAERIARLNLLRGLLREWGMCIPVGAARVVPLVSARLAEEECEIPSALRLPLQEACAEVREMEARIDMVEKQLRALAKQTPVVKRLLSIPGVGLLGATAMVAFVGDVKRFATSRHFASYLGLTPREHSSGQVRRLGSISRRGDAYLRCLLVHGARAVLNAAKRRKELDSLRAWALRTEQRRGHNKATVALANKLARIVWAVWKSDTPFAFRSSVTALAA
jgi:transposase